MMTRRLLALLTMFVMFHLALVGPDAACATHSMHEQAMTPPASEAASHSMEHGDSKIPCDTPSSAHCCDAVTSCGVVAAIETPDRAAPGVALATPVPPSTASRLLSRALAPEPPPPKR
jgi:hypothetical protein